jgi:nucleoside-diphosphate-sugar epimerase
MKVLVTGGTGFAGSHTVRALTAAGHDIRLLVRDPAKVRTVFEPLDMVPKDVVVGDMTDADAVETALRGCDGVVHAAASVELRRAAARRVESANVRGVELVVGGAARLGLPNIVHVSSLGVFFVPGGPPLSPELPIAPGTTAYARSKSTAELYVRRLQEEGAPICISYPGGILGPNDPGPSAVPSGLASFMRDGWLITSGGIQVVDVRDLATLHLMLLEMPTGACRYGAAADMVNWPDLYAAVCRMTGTRPRVFKVPGAVMRAAGTVGDAIMRVRDFDFPLTRDAMEFTTRWPGADVERTTRELGIRFRPPEDTYRDTLIWLYQAGHLTAAQVGDLATPAVRS